MDCGSRIIVQKNVPWAQDLAELERVGVDCVSEVGGVDTVGTERTEACGSVAWRVLRGEQAV